MIEDTPELREKITEYVQDFVKERFPDGELGDNLKMVVQDIAFDAFFDGVMWADMQKKVKSPIIIAKSTNIVGANNTLM